MSNTEAIFLVLVTFFVTMFGTLWWAAHLEHKGHEHPHKAVAIRVSGIAVALGLIYITATTGLLGQSIIWTRQAIHSTVVAYRTPIASGRVRVIPKTAPLDRAPATVKKHHRSYL